MLPWVAIWVLLFVAWHVFAGKINLQEALLGIVGTTAATAAAWVVYREHLAPFHALVRHALQIFRLPWLIVTGTWEILAALGAQLFLGRPAESLRLTVAFDPGGDDEESAFRRAVAIAYTSATPNFVIIGIDRERGVLHYHQLKRSKIPRLLQELGAKP